MLNVSIQSLMRKVSIKKINVVVVVVEKRMKQQCPPLKRITIEASNI
jgi:hypothetical protein